MKKWNFIGLVLMLALMALSQANASLRPASPASMNKNTSELFQASMKLADKFWDGDAKLIENPYSGQDMPKARHHMVRESSWYALGLLLRDKTGDRQRAADILDAVLKQQFVTPGVRWYGTFRRAPEESDPAGNLVIWRGYDPNWREFIGTTFAMILIEYPDRNSPELSHRLYAAIDRAVEGEISEKRLLPSYTNIALMYGFLLDFAAAHDHRADWKQQSAEWTESVYRLFKQYNAFAEYNSPTYCGVDLYGLATWRTYGSNMRMRTLGSEMEATLWRDLADFYQPELRNISGPYDRAYGMDMESYVSLVGVWMRTAMDARSAPLPALTESTDHLPDIWFAPHIAILGTRIPPDALARMKKFDGEHLLRKQITDQRVATAWIGRDVIYGGEATGKTKDAGATTQFHPATIQWRTPSGEIGWVRLVQSPMVDATADEHGLTISTTGTIRLRIHAKDMAQAKIGADTWDLPGLQVAVRSDAKNFSLKKVEGGIDLVYSGITGMRLEIKTVR